MYELFNYVRLQLANQLINQNLYSCKSEFTTQPGRFILYFKVKQETHTNIVKSKEINYFLLNKILKLSL